MIFESGSFRTYPVQLGQSALAEFPNCDKYLI
jgi:hypothetical protein